MTRKYLDQYTEQFTTQVLTEQLLMHVPEIRGLILEPCAGEGFMAEALRQNTRISSVVTNDIEPGFSTKFQDDARSINASCWNKTSPNWVVTNPPYVCAHPILINAFRMASDGVAFLLRQTYDEPTMTRACWLQEHADQLRYRIPVNPRPRWRGGINPKTGKQYSTDSATNTWFVWLKHFSWVQDVGIQTPFRYITNWRNKA